MIIYLAENKVNGKCYIGQTTKSLKYRIDRHFQSARYNHKKQYYFINSIRKHGEGAFSWKVICETDSKDKLNALEKLYIAVYSKEYKLYNMTSGGESGSGKKSEATKEKLRIANLGKKQSEHTKEKRKKSMIGKNTGKRSPEIIDKIRNAIISNGGYHANSGSFKNGMSPWNKGLKSNIDQSGNKNPFYRHDVSNNKIQELFANGLSVKEISVIMQCNDRTVYRRINKMRLI